MPFVPGLIVGALAGAAVALLTTPRNGRENREALLTHLPEAQEEVPRLLDRARAEIQQRIDAGRDAFLQTRDETRRKMTHEFNEKRLRRGDLPAPPRSTYPDSEP